MPPPHNYIISMKKKTGIYKPLYTDENGMYITVSQMECFLNRPRGQRLFEEGANEFFSYFRNCQNYNMISDMMLDDPECAEMYWDPVKRIVGFKFPENGSVARKFRSLEKLETNNREEEEEYEDYFGKFKDDFFKE